MSNEIKEILELFKEYASGGMSGLYPPEETIGHLLDCITNLQQENDYFNKKNIELSTLNTSLRSNRDDYKSRCEKAIELLKEVGCYDEETKTFCDDIWEELPYLLNILQGGDKDVN